MVVMIKAHSAFTLSADPIPYRCVSKTQARSGFEDHLLWILDHNIEDPATTNFVFAVKGTLVHDDKEYTIIKTKLRKRSGPLISTCQGGMIRAAQRRSNSNRTIIECYTAPEPKRILK